MQAVKNALDGVEREISTRYDFKGSSSKIENNDDVFFVFSESEQKRKQILDLILTHLTRKKVSSQALELGKIENASGNMMRQEIKFKQGITKEHAQTIIKNIKSSKLKLQVSIQGNELRVTGKKRDDLQSSIQLIKELKLNIPIDFINFRD